MASSSSSSPPLPAPSSSVSCTYDVFLSFRGKDTRKGLVDHLYAALDQRGISTFKDDQRLRGGELIQHKLLQAIEQSRSAIVVFSKGYASSSWCLDELEKIMECKEKLGLAVYPVFYDVAPSDVRGQRGTFGEGFAKAAKRMPNKADLWRKALSYTAGLSGYDVQNTADGLESHCIKIVVEWCSNHSCSVSTIDEDLIGMPSRVRNLMMLLEADLDDVRFIGIWGMGGAGKTTLANVTFHEVKKKFDGASFIYDVREKSKKIDGLEILQKKILSDILMDEKLKVESVPEGKEMIKRRLGHKKVLIILDDVDDDEQLSALAGDREWFGKGSRVLITTRDRHVLEAGGVYENDIQSVNLLSNDEAILLFNRHAFKKGVNTIKEEYNELSLHVVRYAMGLPLALKVLGSHLCGRDVTVWTSVLKKLKKGPPKKILDILQISYDGLDQDEKKLFLDIACLFKGWRKAEIITICDCCEYDSVSGIDVLVQKSLISLSEDQRIEMHDLLEEMGRKIGGESRLSRYEDIVRVLQNNNNTETEAIEAIVDQRKFYSKHYEIDAKAFKNMKKLRILYLFHVHLDCVNKLEYLSADELQYLHWGSYPHESLPESFQAPKLARLEMPNSSMVKLWEGTKRLYKLKHLDLRFSANLERTPDFSGIPNLETLDLGRCSSLREVHPSIGDLQKLVLLDLSWCFELVDLPETIGRLKKLEILLLSYSPIGSGYKPVFTSGLMLNDATRSRPLQHLSRLSCLRFLHLGGCRLFEEDIPVDIGKLSFLEEWDLSDNPFPSLPSSISLLSRLKILCLSGCALLKALPELPSSIAILLADGCKSLECMEGLPEKCEWLWKLSLTGCSSLLSCDHNCHSNNKEKLSSISSGQSSSAEERVFKAASGYCPKHSKLTQVVTYMLLQGRALVNHQLSISCSPGMLMDPWGMWFDGQQQVTKGNELELKLPPNWQNETIGFAMCFAFRHSWLIICYALRLEIRFPKVLNSQSVNIPLSCIPKRLDDSADIVIWIGYISFKMLRRTCEGVNIPADLIDNATQLLLAFKGSMKYDSKEGLCGARVVDKRELDHMQILDWLGGKEQQQQYGIITRNNFYLDYS